jgi:glutamate formiminotransferase/formiminotetrahydrofolate cyclodeaminase
MSTALVECVPNFSEARRPEVVEAIQQSIQSVPTVRMLDRHSDMDHNRTVITFIGPPEGVEEAAFQGICKAAELIDLDQHTGAHPRIGATDVVPFVPISGVEMQDCVEMARHLGKRVGDELGIPVYLYEEAATRPERQNLEDIRRGQYEALKTEIATDPGRLPDFGPAHLGPAGATVIGARQFLIAFNVYLTTDDVSIARKIAKTVRHSSGGLRFVKGLGLLVDGRAQVSMNLTNFHSTPLAQVVEMVRREAARYGVAIHHSELVGLIPQEALVDAAVWYMQMDQFEHGQVLEQRLYSSMQQAPETHAWSGSMDFLDDLAAGTAAPGGGSASAYSGAAAAALVAMVARLTIGKKKYAAVDEPMQAVLRQAEELRSELTAAIDEDARSFEAVMEAYHLPKQTPEEQATRHQAVEQALLGATRVPLKVAERSLEVVELAAQVVAQGNLNAICDGGVAVAMGRAALTGAGHNVRINISTLQDASVGRQFLDRLAELERRSAVLDEQVQKDLVQRGGLPPV